MGAAFGWIEVAVQNFELHADTTEDQAMTIGTPAMNTCRMSEGIWRRSGSLSNENA